MPSSTVQILLPVYNAAATLKRSLKSIYNQSFGDWEVLLVDDGSTDETVQISETAAQSDSRIKLIRQAHQGIAVALQTGMAAATAPYIARMDADDVMHPTRLEKQVTYLQQYPEIGLVSCLVKHVGEQAQEGYAAHVSWLNRLVTPEEITLGRFIDAPLSHPSVMFRRAIYESQGGYTHGDFPEDYALWLQWLEAGVRMAKVPEVLMDWYDPTTRLSRTHAAYREEAFWQLKAPYLVRWLEKNNPRHPEIIVWGAGRKSRQRLKLLTALGLKVSLFLDVKVGGVHEGVPVLHYDKIRYLPDDFVLSMVTNRKARGEIQQYLLTIGRVEGKNFLLT